METNLTPIAVSTAHPLRFPDHPIAGQAGHDVEVRHLPEGGAIFFAARMDRKKLGHAASVALEAVPTLDLGASISGMLDAGAFTSAEFEDEP
jgi:hypothetical protein